MGGTTGRRALDGGFLVAGAAVLGWAAWGAATRLPALLHPAPGAADERTAAFVALAAWPLLAAGWGVLVRDAGRADVRGGALVRALPARAGAQAVALLGALAILAPLCAPWDWRLQDLGPHLAPPSLAHPFGTDTFGRDLLSRCLYAARVSLAVGALAVAVATGVGTAAGVLAGFLGGWTDRLLTALGDLLLALPRLVLLLALLAVLELHGGGRVAALIAVLGLTGWMGVARVVRAQVRSLREREFVLAARALGVPTARVLAVHVLPHVLPLALVHASLAVGATLLAEAALSFLGLGVSPPTPTWGVLVHEGWETPAAPWATLFPGGLIVAATLAFNLLGDGVRDALDPRARELP